VLEELGATMVSKGPENLIIKRAGEDIISDPS
jgi:hypothetical protein